MRFPAGVWIGSATPETTLTRVAPKPNLQAPNMSHLLSNERLPRGSHLSRCLTGFVLVRTGVVSGFDHSKRLSASSASEVCASIP